MRILPGLLIAALAIAGELRLVDVQPPPTKPEPPWLASYAEAEGLARMGRKAILLYFTAKW